MNAVLRLVPFAVAVAAVVALSPIASAISPEAAYVQLQLAKLLFSDGREFFQSCSINDDHPGLFGVARIDEHAPCHGSLRGVLFQPARATGG